jgi:hypothetical protein
VKGFIASRADRRTAEWARRNAALFFDSTAELLHESIEAAQRSKMEACQTTHQKKSDSVSPKTSCSATAAP